MAKLSQERLSFGISDYKAKNMYKCSNVLAVFVKLQLTPTNATPVKCPQQLAMTYPTMEKVWSMKCEKLLDYSVNSVRLHRKSADEGKWKGREFELKMQYFCKKLREMNELKLVF